MKPSARKRRPVTACFAAIGFAWIVWLAWPTAVDWHRARLAHRLAEQAAASEDDKVELPLRQLASMDLAPIEPLAASAASPRAAVAQAARQILSERLDSWRLRAHESENFQRGLRLELLAHALAANVDRLDPEGKQWAGSLALQILDDIRQEQTTTTERLIDDCNRVLEAVPRQSTKRGNLARSERGLPGEVDSLPTVSGESSNPTSQTPLEPTLAADQMPASVKSQPPQSQRSIVSARRWRSAGLQPTLQTPGQTAPAEPILLESEKQPGSHSATLVDVPSPAKQSGRIERLRELSTQVLIRTFSQSDHFLQGAKLTVLRERGVTAEEELLFSQLASPDPAVRRQLIEALSVLPATRARQWLHWLVGDPSSEIRLRALAALATTNDPQLFELARERAIKDTDPRVAELASQIMELEVRR